MNEVANAISGVAGESVISSIGLGLGLGVGLIVLLAILSRFLYICRPNQLLVVSGRKRRTEDGSVVGRERTRGSGFLCACAPSPS
jgi:flotillin